MGSGGPGDPVPGNLRNLNMISLACCSSQLSHSLSWLTKIIDFFVVWVPVTPKLVHVGGGRCKKILSQVPGRWLTCIECQYYCWLLTVLVPVLARSCCSWAVTLVPSVSSWRLARADWLLQPAAQLGLRNQLLGTARGSTVLSQPGNVINTNYLLLLPSPDLPLTLQKTNIYHTWLYCTMLLCSLSPDTLQHFWEYYTHNIMIIIILSD